MTPPLSAAARSTVVEHLERALCDPVARAAVVGRAGPPPATGIDAWDADLLQQLMDDPRRLELLEDDELRQLLADPVGLAALADEIAHDWWPAWAAPLAAAGRHWQGEASRRPPTYEDIAPDPAAAAVSAPDTEMATAHLGQQLDKPHESKLKPLLFEWQWTRTRKQMDVPSASPADARLATEFTLTAYGKRQGQPGEWVLRLTGDPPPTPEATVTVRLDGWGGTHTDHTAVTNLGPGVTSLLLKTLPDPDAVSESWLSGTAVMTVACDGPTPWRVTDEAPGPRLDGDFYRLWADPRRDDGMTCCLARLRGILGGPRRTEEERVYDAVEEASREVYRRRYARKYRGIASTGEFTRVVVEVARRRYLQSFRGRVTRVFRPIDPDTDAAPAGDPPEARESLEFCLGRLTEDERRQFLLRFGDGLDLAAVGEQLHLSGAVVRVQVMRAIRKLRECLGLQGWAAG